MKTLYNLPQKALFYFVLFFCFSLLSFNLYGQVTNIPDPNFEQALIDLGIDSDGIVNGQVLTSDIETVTNLNISNKGINDLTGIEDFSALEVFDVSFNLITSLSLTNNLNLRELVFDHSDHLFNIDISNNNSLEILRSSFSFLSQLDLTNNPNLRELILGEPSPSGNHAIENLDLRNNIMLIKLQLINLELLRVVDLRSGSNAILTDVFVECSTDGGFPCEPLPCFMVDDLEAAQNNQFPYSEWEVMVIYSDDCALGLPETGYGIISLFPNPTKNELFLTSNNTAGSLKLKIFNIEGKLLSNQNIAVEKETSIDVSQLSSGIYFLNIEDENGNTTIKKFIKQ